MFCHLLYKKAEFLFFLNHKKLNPNPKMKSITIARVLLFNLAYYVQCQAMLDFTLLKSLAPAYTTATTIDLTSKSIFYIDSLTFNYTPQVFTTLTLTSNLLTSVSATAFKYCTLLRTLILSKNSISRIDSGSFNAAGLTQNLQVLDLSYNNFTALSYTDILGTSNLVELRLNNNQLASVTNLFQGSTTYYTKLTTVYLNSNLLTSVTESTFSMLTNLVRIYLNDNKLITVPAKSFYGLVNLQYIYIGNNPIATSAPYSLIQLCLGNPKCHVCLYTSCVKSNGDFFVV